MCKTEWHELESDPGLFTLLLEDFGVRGLQVEEIYDLSKPITDVVYGFIFLFRWGNSRRKSARRSGRGSASYTTLSGVHNGSQNPTDELTRQSNSFDSAQGDKIETLASNSIDLPAPSSSSVTSEDTELFFARQTVQNACATHALLSVLFNRPELDLGHMLTEFLKATRHLSPEAKGMAIGNMPQLAQAHNRHASKQTNYQESPSLPTNASEAAAAAVASVLLATSTQATPTASLSTVDSSTQLNSTSSTSSSSVDTFHFVSYVPFRGFLYEIDGLKSDPINHGPLRYPHSEHGWTEQCAELLKRRMQEHDVRYSLMAVVPDRRLHLIRRMRTLAKNHQIIEHSLLQRSRFDSFRKGSHRSLNCPTVLSPTTESTEQPTNPFKPDAPIHSSASLPEASGNLVSTRHVATPCSSDVSTNSGSNSSVLPSQLSTRSLRDRTRKRNLGPNEQAPVSDSKKPVNHSLLSEEQPHGTQSGRLNRLLASLVSTESPLLTTLTRTVEAEAKAYGLMLETLSNSTGDARDDSLVTTSLAELTADRSSIRDHGASAQGETPADFKYSGQIFSSVGSSTTCTAAVLPSDLTKPLTVDTESWEEVPSQTSEPKSEMLAKQDLSPNSTEFRPQTRAQTRAREKYHNHPASFFSAPADLLTTSSVDSIPSQINSARWNHSLRNFQADTNQMKLPIAPITEGPCHSFKYPTRSSTKRDTLASMNLACSRFATNPPDTQTGGRTEICNNTSIPFQINPSPHSRTFTTDELCVLLNRIGEQLKVCRSTLLDEERKRQTYQLDDSRRIHNYEPFIRAYLLALAQNNMLQKLVYSALNSKNPLSPALSSPDTSKRTLSSTEVARRLSRDGIHDNNISERCNSNPVSVRRQSEMDTVDPSTSTNPQGLRNSKRKRSLSSSLQRRTFTGTPSKSPCDTSHVSGEASLINDANYSMNCSSNNTSVSDSVIENGTASNRKNDNFHSERTGPPSDNFLQATLSFFSEENDLPGGQYGEDACNTSLTSESPSAINSTVGASFSSCGSPPPSPESSSSSRSVVRLRTRPRLHSSQSATEKSPSRSSTRLRELPKNRIRIDENGISVNQRHSRMKQSSVITEGNNRKSLHNRSSNEDGHFAASFKQRPHRKRLC